MRMNKNTKPMMYTTATVDRCTERVCSEGVYVSKYDVRSAFYRLQAPEWMVPFLAIPRVPGAWFGLDTEWVFPCFTVLPMGHSHSALLCQEAHAEVLRRAGFGDEQRISPGGGRWVGSVPRFFVYLDRVFRHLVQREGS